MSYCGLSFFQYPDVFDIIGESQNCDCCLNCYFCCCLNYSLNLSCFGCYLNYSLNLNCFGCCQTYSLNLSCCFGCRNLNYPMNVTHRYCLGGYIRLKSCRSCGLHRYR